MILVVGASSQTGRNLIPMLVEKGYPVRAVTRVASKLQYAESLPVEILEGNICQPDMLGRACEGAEAVISSVVAPGKRLLMDAAKRSGARHFVFVSDYGTASHHDADVWRVQYQTEEYLKTLNMDYTILRPTACMETWCTRLGAQVMHGQEVTIFGDGRNPINFISAQDVANFIILALEDPRLQNRTLTIGGPQNLTFEDVVDMYESKFSKCVARKYISAARMKLMSNLYALFDGAQARILAIRHELATSNWQVDMTETIKHYPIHLTTLEDWISSQ